MSRLLLWLLLGTLARAQEPAKDDLTELYSKLGAVSPKLVKAGYTVLHVEFDRLAAGGEYLLRTELSPKNKYKVVGVGAKGIQDLKLRVVNSKGKLEVSDGHTDNVAIVNFVPKSAGVFTLKLGAAKIDGQRPYFFCLISSKPK